MQVEIYKLKSKGRQEVVASCSLEDDVVVCVGDKKFVERLREGILDRSIEPPQKIFPSDGRRFLELLKDYFKSGYLVASDILE